MDTAYKSVDFLKIQKPFRDFLVLVCGLGSIVFFEFLGFEIFSYIYIENLGKFENDIIIIIASFIFGKMLQINADMFKIILEYFRDIIVIIFLLDVPLRQRIRLKYNFWRINHKKVLRDFLDHQEEGQFIRPSEVKNLITQVDIADVLKDRPSLSNENEREVYHILVLKSFFSTFLILSFVTPNITYIFLSILFLSLFIGSCYGIRQNEHEIIKGIVKLKYVENKN